MGLFRLHEIEKSYSRNMFLYIQQKLKRTINPVCKTSLRAKTIWLKVMAKTFHHRCVEVTGIMFS